MTLTEFLLARIDEDEAEIGPPFGRDEKAGPNGIGWAEVRAISEVLMSGQARALAECEAKRRIVALHAITWQRDREWTYLNGGDGPHMERFDDWAVCSSCGQVSFTEGKWVEFGTDVPHTDAACPTIRTLAAIYADHPDYREEWKP
jgi:hypothetical protein